MLALAGVAGIAAISASASNGRLAKSKQIKQEGEIGKAQTTIYDREKESKDLQKSQKRYNELAQKSIKTEEEKEEMSSLIESMKQANEEWENLSDDRLLEEVNKRIIENNLRIDALIESNYKAALEMKNLSQSVVGQRAIADKLIKEQDKLIKTNTKLIELNDPRIAENVAAASASVIDKVVANYDYSKLEAAEKADVK